MKLSANQQEAIAEGSSSLISHPEKILVLEGLSGVGKSTVAESIAKNTQMELQAIYTRPLEKPRQVEASGLYVLDVDANFLELFQKKVFGIIRAIQSGRGKIAVLANAERGQIKYDSGSKGLGSLPYPEHAKALSNHGLDSTVVNVGSMTDGEIEAFILENSPEIPTDQLALIKKYSLGIPLLVKKLSVCQKSLTDENAAFITKMYLNDYFFGNFRPDKVQEILKRRLERKVDLELIEGSQRSIQRNIRDGLRGVLNIEYPIPVCQETLGLYERLGEYAGTLTIFIPSISHGQFLKGLGFEAYSSHRPRGNDGRLAQLEMMGRKTYGIHAQYPNVVHGSSELHHDGAESHEMQKFTAKLGLKATPRSAFISSHEHEGVISDQVIAGYASETYLQGVGIEYYVDIEFDNGGGSVTYRFDPTEKKYMPAKKTA